MGWLALDIFAVLTCLLAAVLDLRSLRIPNWLTFGSAGVALVGNFAVAAGAGGFVAGLSQGLGPALIGGLVLLLVFGLFAGLKTVGMGDVKLAAAVGCAVRWPLALWVLLYVIVAGGIVSLFFAVSRGRLIATLRGLTKPPPLDSPTTAPIPYGIAIFLGTLWAVVVRYMPQLRFP